MKIACFYLTEQGRLIAEQIVKITGGDIFDKNNFKENVEKYFYLYDALIFIMASGIVIRTIAPLLKSKTTDPAVILVSQDGRYVVSLLSGHLGGANEITKYLAKKIGANPVITTATDVQKIISFDVFAKKNGLIIENIDKLKYISSALLSGETIDLITDYEIDNVLDNINFTEDITSLYSVVISDRIYVDDKHKETLYLRPRDIVIGIGCKKNISPDYLDKCFSEFLDSNKISSKSIKYISTIDLKQDEEAIHYICEKYNAELKIADKKKIELYADKFENSEFVKNITGVPSVAEGSAFVISENGVKISGKTKYSGVTIAAYRCILPKFVMRCEYE